MTWAATITTADLSLRIDVTAMLTEFTGVTRHLAGGEWDARLPSSVWPRIVAVWPAQDAAPLLFALRWVGAGKGTIISGPIREARLERSNGVETVALSGVDEFSALLDSRVVYPEPGNGPPWNVSDYHSLTAPASTAIASLVSLHAGSSALAQRAVPGVAVDDIVGGATRTWRFRLSTLAEAVADIASAEGLRIDVRRQATGAIAVRVDVAQNRTQHVIDETKLSDFTVTLSTGTATTLFAGGSGEGAARLFASAGDAVAGAARREAFTDQRSIGTMPTLQAAADAHRSAGSASTSLVGRLLPTTNVHWRDNYELGDLVTLRVHGVRYEAQVTAVSIQIGATGLTVSPVLGKASRFALTQLVLDVAGLSARLSALEAS